MQIPDWNTVESFFYRGMDANGHSSQHPCIEKLVSGRGCRTRFEEGDLRLDDVWTSNPNTLKSAGATTILVRSIDEIGQFWMPLWEMHYGGWYAKEATPLLKKVLRSSYAEHHGRPFQGCRGPEELWFDDHWVYQNMPSPNLENSFKQFESHERIRHYPNGMRTSKDIGTGIDMGCHSIFGTALV